MKKFLCLLMVLALLSGGISGISLAQDPTPAPVVEAVTTADAEAVVEPSTPATEETKAEAVTPVETEDGVGTSKAITANIVLLIIQIGGAALVCLLVGIAWKLLGKIGLEKNEKINGMLSEWVWKAVKAAESWGKKNEKSGNEKLDKAVEFVNGLAESSGVKKVARDKIETMVEAYLQEEKETEERIAASNGNG